MTEAIAQFQKLIEKQFHALKKDRLNYICQDYTQTSKNTKQDMTKIIYYKLTKELTQMKSKGCQQKHLQQFLINFWKKYELTCLNLKLNTLKAAASAYYHGMQDVQLTRPSTLPNIAYRNPRQLPTQLAVNILKQNKKCICQQPSKQQKIDCPKEICFYCDTLFHVDCLWPKQREDDIFECPFCYMKLCNPARQVKQTIFASYIFKKDRQKCQTKIKFQIPNELKKDKKISFQLRCIRLGCKISKFQITFPDSCSISINNKKLTEFKPNPKNSPLKRRHDQSLKIQICHLNNGENQLKIDEKNVSHTKQDYPGKIKKFDHIIMLVAVQTKGKSQIQNFYNYQFQNVEKTVTHLKQIVKKDNSYIGGQFEIQMIKIPLYCQFYGGNISVPVRSRHCTHSNVFDAKNFIMAMMINTKQSSLRWKCPLCKKRSYDLVLDKFLLQIIGNNRNKKLKQVIINPKDVENIKDQDIIEEQQDKDGFQDLASQNLKQKKLLNSNNINSKSQPYRTDVNIDDDVEQQQQQKNQNKIVRSRHPHRVTNSYRSYRQEDNQQNEEEQNEIRMIPTSSQQFTGNKISDNNCESNHYDSDQLIQIDQSQFIGNNNSKNKDKQKYLRQPSTINSSNNYLTNNSKFSAESSQFRANNFFNQVKEGRDNKRPAEYKLTQEQENLVRKFKKINNGHLQQEKQKVNQKVADKNSKYQKAVNLNNAQNNNNKIIAIISDDDQQDQPPSVKTQKVFCQIQDKKINEQLNCFKEDTKKLAEKLGNKYQINTQDIKIYQDLFLKKFINMNKARSQIQ